MLSSRFALLVLPTLVAACAGGFDDEEYGGALGQAAREVVNGTPVVGYPTAGSLQRSSNGGLPTAVCTGTLIGCDTFLTAGHCVCDDDDLGNPCGIPTPAEDLSVFFQHAGSFKVASVHPHLGFDFPDNDIAIVRLAEPVTGIRPTPITIDNPALDAALTIVGFGITVKGGTDGGIKREGALLRTACANHSDELMLCYDPDESPTVSCNGDSGGPNYIDMGGVEHVAGIVSGGGTSDSCSARQKFATGTFGHIPFIVDKSGELGGECGDIADVLDAEANITVGEGEGTRVYYSVEVPTGTAELRVGANSRRGFKLELAIAHEREPDYIVDDCGGEGRMSSYCEVHSPTPGTWNVVVSGDTEHQLAMTTLPGAPTAVTDLYEAISGGVLRVAAKNGLLVNDLDAHDGVLRSEVSAEPRHGTIEIDPDGSFVYEADSDYIGIDSFSYRVHEDLYSAETRVFLEVREEELGDCGCRTSSSRSSSGPVLMLLALFASGRRRRKRA